MKKIYILALLLLPFLTSKAQSFTTSGPRTFYSNTAASTDLYFNFDKGKLVPGTDTWHMKFKSTEINFDTLNNVQAQLIANTSFASQTTAPTSGYANKIDNNTGGGNNTGTGVFNYAGVPTHIISPIPGKIIAVKLADGRYVKIEMISYYKYAPVNIQDSTYTRVSSKYYSFRYLISAASSTDWSQQVTKISNLKVPASSSSDYQYVNLAIADTTLLTTDHWNFKIRATGITANDNWSTAQLEASAFNSITAGSALTSGVLSGWYAYEGDYTHTISAVPNKTIVFKDSLGRYGKLVIESYYKNGGAVICAGSGYYTVQYYYNPYGDGETMTGRDGVDLATYATLLQSVSPVLSLSASSIPVAATGLTTPETINVTSNDSWIASTSDSWITLANVSGTGDGSFTITTGANAGAQRQGTVTLTYCNGATKSVAVTQTGIATGTIDPSTETINIYPNPSSDKFNIDLGSHVCEEISVTNLQGQTVWSTNNPAVQQEINIQGWNKGVYFLKISSQGRISYQKIEVND